MAPEAQLAWEARAGRPAGAAAILSAVAGMAGISKKRGDTLAVSRVKFAAPPVAPAVKASPLAKIGNPMALAKKALIAPLQRRPPLGDRRRVLRRSGEQVRLDRSELRAAHVWVGHGRIARGDLDQVAVVARRRTSRVLGETARVDFAAPVAVPVLSPLAARTALVQLADMARQ